MQKRKRPAFGPFSKSKERIGTLSALYFLAGGTTE